MKLAFAHPFTLSADLLENGTQITDVKFIGIERYGNIGILDLLSDVIGPVIDSLMLIFN
jgi:hypothetical protein